MSILSYLFQKSKIAILPSIIQIEPTNKCNLKCSLCLTGAGKLKRNKGDMSFQTFKEIVWQLQDNTTYLVLYHMGEPLLNKDIYRMIEYAKKKKIYVKLSTNGCFSDRQEAENLVKSRIDELIISLDCTDPQTFMRYKGIDRFDMVRENIKMIIRERAGRTTPFVNLQLLPMKETENEILKFKKTAYRLGIDRVLIKPVRVNFPGIPANTDYLPKNAKYIRRIYKESYKKHKCFRPWVSAVFLWDGSVVPCCFDMEGDYNFGNIRQATFRPIWNSREYILFRKQILNNQNIICKECSFVNIF